MPQSNPGRGCFVGMGRGELLRTTRPKSGSAARRGGCAGLARWIIRASRDDRRDVTRSAAFGEQHGFKTDPDPRSRIFAAGNSGEQIRTRQLPRNEGARRSGSDHYNRVAGGTSRVEQLRAWAAPRAEPHQGAGARLPAIRRRKFPQETVRGVASGGEGASRSTSTSSAPGNG